MSNFNIGEVRNECLIWKEARSAPTVWQKVLVITNQSNHWQNQDEEAVLKTQWCPEGFLETIQDPEIQFCTTVENTGHCEHVKTNQMWEFFIDLMKPVICYSWGRYYVTQHTLSAQASHSLCSPPKCCAILNSSYAECTFYV